MKRFTLIRTILAVLVILVMCLPMAGCGGTISSWFNTAVTQLCNPTAAQKADAQTILNAANGVAAAFAASGNPVAIAIAAGLPAAEAVFTDIVNGACTDYAKIEQAYNSIQAANTAAAASTPETKALSGIAKPFVLPPLGHFIPGKQ
jgi:hypothetical protein